MDESRRMGGALKWARAVVYVAAVMAALGALPFYPPGARAGLALAAGALSLVAPGLGVIACVAVLTPPLVAADAVTGSIFLVVGLAAAKFLSDDDGAVFLTIALAFLASRLGLEWAVAVLAGYVLGSSEGAVAALIACLCLETAGTLLGHPSMGVTVTGAGRPDALLAGYRVPEAALSFGWLPKAFLGADPQRLMDTAAGLRNPVALAVQPVLWALGALAAASLRRSREHPRRAVFGLIAAATGAVVLAAGAFAVFTLVSPSARPGSLGIAAVGSLAVAVAAVAVWEWVFPPVRVTSPLPAGTGIDAEDADVDELLRLIATAEEELTSKHTVQGVVMITDMKSFSRMTEEDGSMISAKLIQRHRDLLLPIIEKHGGHGKSTGGDGLVAAFDTAAGALSAACEMQRTLAEYNAGRPGERDLTIRVGVASGELVLDRRGRPFIGSGLNLAARVMNLGDGEQVMTTARLLDEAGRQAFRHASHGRYDLKNIAEKTEVVELLWAEGQLPCAPQVKRGPEEQEAAAGA